MALPSGHLIQKTIMTAWFVLSLSFQLSEVIKKLFYVGGVNKGGTRGTG
jgi:hypothetical protein